MTLTKLRWWGLPSRSQARPAPAPRGRGRRGAWAFRALLGLAVMAALTYLSPYQRPHLVGSLRVGSLAPDNVKAPFLFHVPKSKEELAQERRQAEAGVPTILDVHPHVASQQVARLDSVFRVLVPAIRLQMPDSLKYRHLQRELPNLVGSLSVDAVQTLVRVLSTASLPYAQDFQAVCRQILSDLYATGIVPSKGPIASSISSRVSIGSATDGREVDIQALYSEEELKQGELIGVIRGYRTIAARDAVEAVHELLGQFIRPNLTVDAAETTRLRAEARRSVASIKRLYARDETIVEKNATVTADHMEALNALAERIAEQELENPIRRGLLIVAAAVIAAFLTAFLGYYLATREPEIFARPGHLLLLALFVVSTAAIAAYIRTNDLDVYLVPIPLAAMLVTILFSPQVGLMLSFVLALFAGALFGDFHVALITSLTAAVAVYSVRHVRHRNQFYRSMLLLPISYVALIAAADLLRFVPLEEVYQHVLPGVFTGVATPILTIGLLPIFESLFHITTDITLLELSDLNRPLLRELAIRSPGTYTHSLIMANLSESAAEAIGANPLLARVGCYYHDIGKMLKPEYFTENQGLRGGRNPHDHLTPNMSMLIIASHVKDGLELAEEHGLPRAISDLIPQHHGTTVIEYFYNRAIELGDEGVRKDDFRYDGPRPQTKEAGILMLADSVESAARTLSERTPNRVRQLVRKIVQQKFTAGELDECALTLQDLHRIEEAFMPVLMGTLHGRVEYPWQKAERRRNRPAPTSPSRE
ncbi:MAG: HDIG domain-containing metalloprotein [Candidatus Latescibacterota bacterium]